MIFVGHGSPMNIIEKNIYTENFMNIGQSIAKPKAIVCVSAHWMTEGTKVTAVAKPNQIYDFYGFPDELYKIKYQPPGAPEMAKKITEMNDNIDLSDDWGLDHGSWAVLLHMFPKQDIPVLQLSLNKNLNLLEHLSLAESLKKLVDQNVLILASGNIVHNLRKIKWEADAPAYEWAQEFEDETIEILSSKVLSNKEKIEKIFSSNNLVNAHPTTEHLLPLIYAIGLSKEMNSAKVLTKGIQNASISMASLSFL